MPSRRAPYFHLRALADLQLETPDLAKGELVSGVADRVAEVEAKAVRALAHAGRACMEKLKGNTLASLRNIRGTDKRCSFSSDTSLYQLCCGASLPLDRGGVMSPAPEGTIVLRRSSGLNRQHRGVNAAQR